MKKNLSSVLILTILFTALSFAQGFKVKASGEQTFNFSDKGGRNQASFFSTTPLEDIRGLSNDVKGTATFNINDIKTLKGKITVSVASIKTGIDLRNEHLRSDNWLDAEKYPEIIFTIKKVSDVKQLADNKLQIKVVGDFTLKGVTKEVTADATLTYLDESEQTKLRAPGDLLGVQATFNIRLSDFGVKNKIVGQKVAEIVEVSVNMVGSNKTE
ncbi:MULTISPECIES: YceI family protein [Ignavibacterium]|jgi:polyisoprenoid-binding protein YceI|uniref:YceI family protein n=1 Tax=Ignavibacterium TaxID=795750 RepID=UPI0025BD0678|nr:MULTISPECIES: YceI family protein [Ignavibacterium]MBI5662429.1 YceI family protein [Ignavibacterium album]